MSNSKERKVLVAVDGSDYAFATIKYTARIPAFKRMKVLLFNVFSEVVESYWDLEKDPKTHRRVAEIGTWETEAKKKIQDYVEEGRGLLVDSGFPKVAVRAKIKKREEGIARDIIKEAARGYDAVAVGRKGTGQMQDLVLGSIAHKLLEKVSFAPLMLVGKGAHTEKTLVALDGSENSERLVSFVGRLLADSTGKVRLFHVIRTHDKQYIEAKRSRMEAVFKGAQKRLTDLGLDPEQITTRIITGVQSRAGAILEEARREAAGTIVVGRRGLSEVHEFFIGRVSNKVIHLAKDLAVWVVN